jgi:hypothetical protein
MPSCAVGKPGRKIITRSGYRAPVIRVCVFDAPECALGVRIDALSAVGVRKDLLRR